jgi:hypothetical protein
MDDAATSEELAREKMKEIKILVQNSSIRRRRRRRIAASSKQAATSGS